MISSDPNVIIGQNLLPVDLQSFLIIGLFLETLIMYVSNVKVSKSIQIWLWEQKFELLLTYFLQDILQMVIPFINEFTINLTLAMSQRIKEYSSNNDLNFRDM